MGIKFLLTSDTHFGHSKNTGRIHEKFLKLCNSKIELEKVSAVIHAGDWASYKQDQFYKTLKMFRKALSVPIATVRGNHDFWSPGLSLSKKNRLEKSGESTESYKPLYGQLCLQHAEWFKEFDIIHLEEKLLVIDDVIVLGFDGWYYKDRPPTNDDLFIRNNIEGAWFHTYLANRAHKQLEKILDTDTSQYRAAICVTHMPSFAPDPIGIHFCANPKYVDFLSEKFDVVCMGHSHQYTDTIINGCRFINSGSHYDMPVAKVFEI